MRQFPHGAHWQDGCASARVRTGENGQGVDVSASGIKTLAFLLLIGLILYVSGSGGM
jgi:hypothetical protein